MRGPGMFRPQPMGMDLQPIQGVPQQEEEQPLWMKALSAGLAAAPSIIGRLKRDKKDDHDVDSVDDRTMTDAAAKGEAILNKRSALQGVAGKVAGWLNGTEPTDQAAQPAPNGMTDTAVTADATPEYMRQYQDALNAPVKKKDAWKDALYKGAVIFSNMMNPQSQMPVVGLGRAQKNRDVARARGMYEQERELDIARQQDEGRRVQRENTIEDNRRQREDLERKQRKTDADIENAKGILADKTRGRDLQERSIRSLENYREYLIENGVKMTDARIKQIDERLKDYDEDRKQRERLFGIAEEGRNNRFNAGLTEKRQQFLMDFERKVKADIAKGVFNKQKQILDITRDADLDEETKAGLLELIGRY